MRSSTFSCAVVMFLLVLFQISLIHVSAATGDLRGVVLLSPTNGWASGDGGIISHYDGFSWDLVPSGTSADLLGVSFGPPSSPNPNAGFAVGGSGGTAVSQYWGGVGWSAINTGLTGGQRLVSVFANNPNDAWAVDGVTGAFWHWSGSAGLGGGWNSVSSAASGLNSIFMTSQTDGWAVGVGGAFYHYTGGGWTLYSTVGGALNSVFMLNSDEGWAVGNGGSIYHYLSGSWNGPISPGITGQNLESVFMVSPSEGWAVGTSGTVIHYQNGLWIAYPPNLLATNQNLNSVYFSGGTGFAVGDGGTIVALGSQPPVQGTPSTSFESVYLSSSSDGWAVGCSTGGCGSGAGEPVVAHWNGASFTRGITSANTADLFSVFMVNSGEGWAVGGVGEFPLILHYTGGTWTQIPAPSSGFILRSVYMMDSNNGFAVGDGGTILRYSSGSWGLVSSPTTKGLRSVFMLGSSDGWAVGEAGTILRYQSINGQWVQLANPTGARLNSVFLLDSTHGWAVGDGGTILHYDGTIWLTVATLTSANLNSVFQVNPQQVWAVGDSGTILEWSGIAWYQVMPSPPLTGNLNSIYLTSSTSGMIVGAQSSPGSQGTVILIGQQGVYPIPEIGMLPLTFVTLLIICVACLTGTGLRKRKEVRE